MLSSFFPFTLVLSLCIRLVSSIPTTTTTTSSSPFSSVSPNPSWPLPHNVTGNTDGWGAVYVHDPSVVKYDDAYYSFTTHDLVAIGKAPTLSGPWEHYGSVLSHDSIIDLPGNNDTWAPDVLLVNGTFYCFYSVSTFGSQSSAIGVATSETLEPGSWTDHGQVIQSGANTSVIPYNITNAIDPAVFIDPADGTAYLNYGSFFADIWQLVLAPDLLSVPTTTDAVQLSIDNNGTRPEEGSFMSFNGGWYYLWFSHGICCGFNASALPAPGQEYSIRVGRSQSARGPFVDADGVALDNSGGSIVYGSFDYVYAPGGEGVLHDEPCQRDILYFHYCESLNPSIVCKGCLTISTVTTYTDYTDNTSRLGWLYVDYEDGWPVLSYD